MKEEEGRGCDEKYFISSKTSIVFYSVNKL